MPQRNILILEKKESPWRPFLIEFFEDTPSKLHFFQGPKAAGNCLDQGGVGVAFVNAGLLTLSLGQKLKVARQSSSDFLLFRMGTGSQGSGNLPYDASFEAVVPLAPFQKQLVRHLPLPEVIRVLVVDDEQEIGVMIRDFFEDRVHPSFEIQCAGNGKEGLERMKEKLPDVLVLDIKMPTMDGRELYREISRKGWRIPTIVFFDAVTGDEMPEIYEIGCPAVVEKGACQSEMPEMMDLIKKMAYFG